jgi:transcriptional regulator with XRE-family HTH domain
MIFKRSYSIFRVISSAQIKAARALLGWTAQELADVSEVGVATIRRMEVMEGVPSGNIKTLFAIQAALEEEGIEFIGSPNDSPGVRLRTQK